MPKKIHIFTIGFTQKSASDFFSALTNHGVRTVIDTRLNNVSQLSGFTKKNDLSFFLKEIANIKYIHSLDAAPTKEMLDDYKKKRISWIEYEKKFIDLITRRRIEQKIERESLDNSCLLCSELKPHYCHRRLVAEYLSEKLDNLEIHHL